MNPLIYLVDWIKAGAITIGVATTTIFQPYDYLNRPVNINDPRPLSVKAQVFDEDLQARHITSENIFLYELPVNLGDMCIWNGVHVAYRAIRYGYTHDPQDLANLKKYMVSLEELQTLPGTKQTILLRGRCPLAEYNGSNGGYRQVHQNDTEIWQEDSSGDSFAGQVYGMAMAYKYGDQEVKDYIGVLARDLYLWMKSNGYNLKNADGSITKFSATGPGVMSSPMTISTYLVLTKILELQYPNDAEVGHEYHTWAITWNQIHVAAHNMPSFFFVKIYPGVNQAKMDLHALLELETNQKYNAHYIAALKRGWYYMGDDGDSFFTFLMMRFAPKSVRDRQKPWGVNTLKEFSVDQKENAASVDLTSDTSIRHVNWGGPRAAQPYPTWQQPAEDYKWQRDPHLLSDNVGCEPNCKHFSGLDFLIAYYIGLNYNFINPND